MKRIKFVILCVVFVLGLALPLLADENGFAGFQDQLFFGGDSSLGVNYDLFANETEGAAAGSEFSYGRRLGAGFLNLVLGLGSYTMGDWRSGLWLTLFDVLTVPTAAISIYLFATDQWFSFPSYFSTGNMGLDLLLLVPVWYGLSVVVWTLPYLSVMLYAVNVYYKFAWPFAYEPSAPKTARLDDWRNWQVGLIPNEEGRPLGLLAFTAHL